MNIKLLLVISCLSLQIFAMDNNPKNQTIASQESIKVAASCYVFKEKKILLRKDHDNHTNQDLWCLPGTYIKHNEPSKDCAARGVKEQTGIDLYNIQHATHCEEFGQDSIHQIIFIYSAQAIQGEITKNQHIHQWFGKSDLPDYLHRHIQKTYLDLKLS